MIRITDKKECCGCTACQSICPHDAIVMKTDVLGFKYPFVLESECTECGLCDGVCDFKMPHIALTVKDTPVKVYVVRNRDREVLAASQSGGVFTALSDILLSEGGVVYGAVMNADFSVSHIRAAAPGERDRMRGSKYVQSDLTGVFGMVRRDLSEGRKVLFTGTPCQVAGLASYIPERLSESLFLVDFICHGVPSPAVWKDYVAEMAAKGRLREVRFRDKSCGGWKVHKESFLFENGRKVVRETFRVLFYKNIMLRESCAVCPYDLANRRSDMTMADFWGVDAVLPEYDGDAGTSMVICHTGKAEELLKMAEDLVDQKDVSLSTDFLSARNPNILRPSRIDKDRMKFEDAYGLKGFSYVARKWGNRGWRYQAWRLKTFFKKMTGIR